MIPINRPLAIFVLLAGVTLLAIGQQAESASVSPSPADQVSAPVNDNLEQDESDGKLNELAVDDDEDDDADEDDGDIELEDEEDYEEYYEGEDYQLAEDASLEEGLAWLAQQHLMIKSDCDALNQTIASNGTKVDSDLKQDYQNCRADLASVESDMRELVNQIIGDGDGDSDGGSGSGSGSDAEDSQ